MKIISLEIENLGVHKLLTLDVSTLNNRLIFLNGSNNHGKTSLLSALEFCLFNHELSPDNLSKLAARDMSVGGNCDVRVRIKLLLDDGNMAVVTREQTFERDAKGNIQLEGDPRLYITMVSNNLRSQAQDHAKPNEWLDANFPYRFKDFVLFDGEKMSKFFDNHVKTAIENAVREIASIDYFESVVKMAEAVLADMRRKQAKLSSKNAEKINQEKEVLEGQLDLTRQNLDTFKNTLNSLRGEQKSLEPIIEGLRSGAEFLAKNRELRDRFDALSSEEEANKHELQQLLWGAGISSFLAGRLKYPIEKQIQIAEANGRYPADFKYEALQALLESGSCICGNHISENKEAAQAIRVLMEKNQNAGKLGAELSELKSTLDKATGQAAASQADVDRLVRRGQKIRSDISGVKIDLRDLAPKLEGLSKNEEQVQALKSAYEKASNRIAELKQNIPVFELRISDLEREIRAKDKEFDAAISNSADAMKLNAKVVFLSRVIEQSADFGVSVLDRVRKRLEKFVSENFAKTDGGRYKTVITDDFNVNTLNKDGTLAKLSEGQKMVKAYMFAFALRSVIGLNLPLLVDTPIGRLDEKNRMFVAQTLASVFDNSNSDNQQAIFLMHDGEYTPWVMEHFKPLAPLQYYLEHFDDEEYEISHLREGIDPEWYNYTAWANYSPDVAEGAKR